MNDCLGLDYMENQGDHHEIQTKMEESNGRQNVSDDSQETQIRTKEGIDQNGSNELKSREDLHKLPDETLAQDGKVVATTNKELTFDYESFTHVFKKMKDYVDASQQAKFEKSIFIAEQEIFNDIFNRIEKHEKNFTNENFLVADKEFRLFIHATQKINAYHLFENDLAYAKKEIFYMYFYLINLVVVQNYLKNVQMPDYLKKMTRFSVSRILVVMHATCLYTDLGLKDDQRPNNCIELLSLMLNYVKTDLEVSDLTLEPLPNDASMTTIRILWFFWEYTDKTILVEDLIKTECLKIMTDTLTKICKTEKVIGFLQMVIISIINNISRHDDGIKQLNALNAVDIIKVFQSQTENHKLNTKCCMTLALLSTPEQIKNDRKRMNSVLDTLLEMVYNASVSSDHRHEGFYICEPVIVLVKLFNDDRTLDYIMEHSQVDLHASSTVEFFINLLIDYRSKASKDEPLKQLTCTAFVNILWSVSFQEKYKKALKNARTEFKELIQNLAKEKYEKMTPNEYTPQYLENIQKAATGLLINIDELDHSACEQLDIVSTGKDNNKKPLIMISYSHENNDFCRQLHAEIHKRGYDIWIDFEFLKTGDLWEQIAIGMKRASVIICLVSEDYCSSKSCKTEATHAFDKLSTKKSIIPVLLQKFELPDWLDIRLTPYTYVRFPDAKQLEQNKLSELIAAIDHSLPPSTPKTDVSLHSSVPPVHHEPTSKPMKKIDEPAIVTKVEKKDISFKSGSALSTTAADQNSHSEKPIEQWNENDIYQWFQYNEILSELRDLCRFKDGFELMAYARIYLETEKIQYQVYSDEFLKLDGITFGQRPLLLHEFTKFSNALRKLQNYKKTT